MGSGYTLLGAAWSRMEKVRQLLPSISPRVHLGQVIAPPFLGSQAVRFILYSNTKH